ncbi:NAD(P)H-hydrate dehydratase [Dethiosulfatarculus sandiegensis]|uniref:Sugar kinase n=1 Tax=Dethiosulfatarculus sandiegensis TaxID=1429043 RepID=A0A0D2GF88_9BACT|nr:NAD(P)H-hydrate dehydratase [Dethiosulfatarculus sandiegensis]KIX13577.1 sugar kinase [Dethiosulfatarculus sandiegensis]
MLSVIGTIPDPDMPVFEGEARLEGDHIRVAGRSVSVNRGTAALLAAACQTVQVWGGHQVFAHLVGDTGLGQGSRELYAHLAAGISDCGNKKALVFHYLQPDADWCAKLMLRFEAKADRPLLIADAGFMYAAKMAGLAGIFDLFTPDMGELAFLADEKAPHPFYTRGFILHEGIQADELIKKAYAASNAPPYLLVKGNPDQIVHQGRIMGTVDSPSVPSMEAMGGTGDTVTGVVSALLALGVEPLRACLVAARTNRLAGEMADVNPASQIMEMVGKIPQALELALEEYSGNE